MYAYLCYSTIFHDLAYKKRGMIFVQPLFDNFWNNPLSHTHMCFYSLSSSFSLYCFLPMRREDKWLSQRLFDIGCTNIIAHKKNYLP